MKAALGRRGSVGPGLPLAALVAFVAAMAALPLLLAYNASPAHAADTCTATTADTTTCTFDTPGTSAWTVPAGVTKATFDVFGAQGGVGPIPNRAGGAGGKATATIPVTPGDTLQVNVGGRGADGLAFGTGTGAGGAGGFNGGADGGSGFYSGSGGGGGASDVRSGAFELADRIIVAGGGGGSGGADGGFSSFGGMGGGAEGASGCCLGSSGGPGLGGTQVAGGAGGLGLIEDGDRYGYDGSKGDLGTGGGGGLGIFGGQGGGGGGGGYYGGGGGGGGLAGGGGGGGSSFGPSGVVFQSGVHLGDGLVTITYTTDNTPPTLTVGHRTDGTNGWNIFSPVRLNISASDSRSGLDGAPTCTDGSTALTLTAGSTAGEWTASVSGEGTHDVSCSVSDRANNSTNASDTVKIDTSAPSISDLGPTTQPNAAGWYKIDVTNRFKATDSGSGLNDACKTAFPANAAGNNIQSKTTSGEGSSLKVTSASCTDVAGNTATGIDSASFKIDKTAPKVSAATPTLTGIGRGTNVVATFSERMGPASITNSTFKLFRCTSSTTCTTQVTNVILSKSTDGLRATINPYGTSSTLLGANTKYKVVVTTGTQDLAGNALDQDPMTAGNQQKSWTFTTKG